MASTHSDFVDRISPLGDRINLYNPSQPPHNQPDNDAAEPHKAIPQGFIDCMVVREEVYVREQQIPLENEFDEDDARSFHWVAYASIGNSALADPVEATTDRKDSTASSINRKSSTSTKIPVGTIRLVPPPHPPHPQPDTTHKADALDTDPNSNVKNLSPETTFHDGLEPYIKLGRLAVIPPFRKAGISRLLIDTALSFARQNPWEFVPRYAPHTLEALKQEAVGRSGLSLSNYSLGGAGTVGGGLDLAWRGLVLVHSQLGVQKVWKRYGFEVDGGMGEWDEEGIRHVGMWRRLGGVSSADARGERRLSRPFVTSP
ncbi:hypothetical protein MBLNU230_g7536t1 [Neophaeotheca triangularis]